MANGTRPGTILCAPLTHVSPSHEGVSGLEYTCLSLYLLWLIVIIGVISIEWYQRTRKFTEHSIHVWITRLPILAGIVPTLFATISAGLEPQRQIESYTQSQASKNFLEVCSNPLNQKFDSAAAIQTFLTECNAVQNRMNADIGGIGIRVSLYISLVVTIFSSLAGHFHQEKTAVKEIGTAQLACESVSPSGPIHTLTLA